MTVQDWSKVTQWASLAEGGLDPGFSHSVQLQPLKNNGLLKEAFLVHNYYCNEACYTDFLTRNTQSVHPWELKVMTNSCEGHIHFPFHPPHPQVLPWCYNLVGQEDAWGCLTLCTLLWQPYCTSTNLPEGYNLTNVSWEEDGGISMGVGSCGEPQQSSFSRRTLRNKQ